MLNVVLIIGGYNYALNAINVNLVSLFASRYVIIENVERGKNAKFNFH